MLLFLSTCFTVQMDFHSSHSFNRFQINGNSLLFCSMQWTVFVTWWTRLQSDSLIFKYFIVLWLFTDGWHRRHVQRPAGGDGPPHSGELSHDSSLTSALHFTSSDFLCSLSELFITHYFLLVIYFRSISLLLAHYSILIFKKTNLNQMFHLWFIILLH